MKSEAKKPATADEFYQTIDQEFAFLISKHGYKQIVENAPRWIEYRKDKYSLRILSSSYGFSVQLEFYIGQEQLPLWPVISRLAERKTPPTDKPQLDEIREYAWRMLYECDGLFEGDPVLIGTIRDTIRDDQRTMNADREQYFNAAEILFELGQYDQCIRHLKRSPFELPSVWQERLSFAQKQIGLSS